MAIKIQPAKTNATVFVDNTSRYAGSKVLLYGEDNVLTFETYKRKPPRFTPTDKYWVIDKAREFRPDLVSRAAYGFTSNWWKIMEANNIKDIWDFKAGVNIRIPDAIF